MVGDPMEDDDGQAVSFPPDPDATFARRISMTTDVAEGETLARLPEKSTMTFALERDLGDADKTALKPGFILRRIVGEGGFGEVWEALQISLERIVAVKRIQFAHYRRLLSNERRTAAMDYQFQQEAMITAQLEHPNIVPVYDLGADLDGHPLLAMKMVRGRPWSEELHSDFDVLSEDEHLAKHLPILIDMMQAVAFAHSKGIVHRDLKPSQVMLGQFGEVMLMDWGLAIRVRSGGSSDENPIQRRISIPTPETAASPAGTPSMMAPEQTLPLATGVTARTDVYLLGGTLYCLLTGSYPHKAMDSASAIARAKEGVVEDPRKRSPERAIPDELAELCLWALQVVPGDRPESVQVMIDRLGDYLTGASARRQSEMVTREIASKLVVWEAGKLEGDVTTRYNVLSGWLAELQKAGLLWPRNPAVKGLRERALRHYAEAAIAEGDLRLSRVMAVPLGDGALLDRIARAEAKVARDRGQRRLAIAGAAVLSVALLLGALSYSIEQKRAGERLEIQRNLAEEARGRAEMASAEAVAQRVIAEAAKLAAEEEQYYSGIGLAEVAIGEGRFEKAWELLAEKSPVAFRRWEWGNLLQRVFPDDLLMRVSTRHFDAKSSPDGETYCISGDKEVVLVDADAGTVIWRAAIAGHNVWTSEFTPDGALIAAGSFDQRIYLLDAATGQVVKTLTGHSSIVRGLSFNRDGAQLASACIDGTVRIWSIPGGESVHIIRGFTNGAYDVDFSPDDSRLLVTALGSMAVVYDTATWEKVLELEGHTENVLAGSFSPDGLTIATAATDRKVRLFDAATGTLKSDFENPGAFLHDLTYSPDGRMILTSDDLGMRRLWDANPGEGDPIPLGQVQAGEPGFHGSFTADGRHILTTSIKEVRRIALQVVTGRVPLRTDVAPDEIMGTRDRVRAYGVPDLRDRIWARREQRWSVPGGVTLATWRDRTFLAIGRYQRFSPDSTLRVEIDESTLLAKVVRVADGSVLASLATNNLIDTAFSPDGNILATAELTDRIGLWNTTDWTKIGELVVDTKGEIREDRFRFLPNDLTFSPDSKSLLVGYLNGKAAVWDVATRERRLTLDTITGMGICVAYSHDGTKVASGGGGNSIGVFDSTTGALLSRMDGHRRTVLSIDFGPSDDRIVSVGRDSTLRVWDVPTGREALILAQDDSENAPIGAAFTEDGMTIIGLTSGGDFRVFEAFPWNKNEYPGDESIAFQDRVETYKRQMRQGHHTATDAPRQ